jgi:DNA-binding beta-propeller fold protein YncE
MCADPVSGNIYVTSRMTRQVLVLDGSGDSVLAAVEVGEVPGETYWNPVRHRAYIANENSHSVSVLRDSPSGIEETPNAEVQATNVGPTIVRGVLRLADDASSSASRLLDATGRKVLDLRPGPNDVSNLTPGVYFVREASAITKVIISR